MATHQARLAPAPSASVPHGRPPTLVWAGALTPYDLETIAGETRSATPGARLVVVLPAGSAREDVALVRVRLAPLRRRGLRVLVRLTRALRPEDSR